LHLRFGFDGYFAVGFLVLIVVGGVLGWLASIAVRGDQGHEIAANVAVGIVAAIIAGAFASPESLMVGLSAFALLLAIIGAAAVLALFNLARKRVAR
jgi:uncharacterized membrane protein YeaQ/YmgE (transglycosylase-associated protein family)